MAFEQMAVRSSAKLKIALEGLPGCGKTFSSLLIAKELGKKIGLLDSENGRALKSCGQPGIPEHWMHEPLRDPTLQDYLEKTDEAEAASVDVLIYDSWSHSHTAALEAVDAMGGNKFSNGWKVISPLQKKLIRKMIAFPGHCIATMRVDTDWSTEKDERGKVVPQKVGLKTVAGKGVEYEFDWVLRFIGGNKLQVMKTTHEGILPRDAVVDRADLPKIARRLVEWLNEGAPVSPRDALAQRIATATNGELKAMIPDLKALSATDQDALRPMFAARKQKLAELEAGT